MGPLDDPDLVLRFWKPFRCLTAFTDRDGRETLSNHIDVPDVYPAGRLDRDSEGLLLLPRDAGLRGALTGSAHNRTYLVQVEGIPTEEALAKLGSGVELKDGVTRPAQVRLLTNAPELPPRSVPIRVRASIPDSWIELSITEGKNRQVRRMTAAVGHPTLRLVRTAIGPVLLNGLSPGIWEPLSPALRHELRSQLRSSSNSNRSRRARRPSGRRSRR